MAMAAMLADIVPELILVGGGVVVLLYALVTPRRLQAGAALLAAAVAAGSLAVSLWMLGGVERLTFADTYAVDGVAVWAKVAILLTTLVVIGLSVEWFRTDPRHGEYYTLLLFSALGAVLLAGATELMQFTLSFLLSSVTGYILVAYHRASRAASEAGIKYFLIGAFTGAAMLIGIAYLFGLAATTTLPGLQGDLTGGALVAGAALVVVALAFKTGAVPAHAWVPDVAQGGPAPVAAFVTTAPKVGGFVFLARFVLVLPPEAVGWRPLLAVLAAATMTLGNLAALWQDDVRRLLGWSAVSQTGYGLLAVVALGRSGLAVPALLFFLLAYTLANVAAFGVVTELRGRTDRTAYAGLARAHPWLAAALATSFLSFIGIPPLAGFPAKLLLFAAAIEAGYTWLAILGIVNTAVSLFYYARVLAPSYFGELVEPVPVLGRLAFVGTLTAAAAVVAAGLVAEAFMRAFASAGLLPG
ncbi:MAG: NADH-quinone oxidoreductase subunit N [Actinomycetota bacterium]|nr:NADH-quinone oxidoreductase subunit N [Actinomycetota bacterium]